MSSESTFSSFIPTYSEEPFLAELAKYEQSIAQQNYAVMQGVYGQTQNITNEVVNQALGNAGMLAGQAGQDFGNYNRMFPGTLESLDREAKDFASTPRIQSEMGRAGATATQAGDAQRQAALRDLESFGVDPSSGRYAALDAAERAQTAASAAGAQNQARVNTEQIGRALRSEELQNLARLPGQGIGEMSTANAATGMAENAQLGSAQTAGNLLGTPQTWASIASGLKYPPLGQSGGSSRGGSSGGKRGDSGKGGGDDTGRGGGQGGGGPSSWNPQGTGTGYNPALGNTGGTGGPAGGPQSGPRIIGSGGGGPALSTSSPDALAGYSGLGENPSSFYGTGADTSLSAGEGSAPTDAFDFSDNSGSPGLPAGEGYAPTDTSDFSDFGDYGGGDSGGDSGDFAEGGDVDGGDDADDGMSALPTASDATTGGKVPLAASPSLGRQTDDIRASLNAEEFVVPRDVARWKGEEYFQKLIDASRKARAMASAQPQMKRPAQGPVRFATRRISPGANLGGAI